LLDHRFAFHWAFLPLSVGAPEDDTRLPRRPLLKRFGLGWPTTGKTVYPQDEHKRSMGQNVEIDMGEISTGGPKRENEERDGGF
jgi:hypothetical protein